MTRARITPKADPFRDTDVIDVRAVRFNQGTTGLVALAGAIFGWPLAWALMSAQLVIGLTFGRQFCLPCLTYFTLIAPRVGEGRLEDSRPPRLANMMGAAFLGAAAIAWWAGAPGLGRGLAVMVTVLAVLAASTGFCVGCEIYRRTARLRGIRPGHHDRIALDDLPGWPPAAAAGSNGNGSGAVAHVAFTHPLCSECHEWEERLRERGEQLISVDVRDRDDLARKYGIAVVPTVFAVDASGEVVQRLAP